MIFGDALVDMIFDDVLVDMIFDDVLVDMIFLKIFDDVFLTTPREKGDISFEITNEKIDFFLSMLLIGECDDLSGCKMYQEAIPDTLA